MVDQGDKKSEALASSNQSQRSTAFEENLHSQDYGGYKEEEVSKSQGLSPSRFNPLALRFKQLKHSSQEGTDQMRSQARHYEKIARVQLWRIKNRGRGDTAINAMIYASRALLNVSRRLLKRTVTPKLIYEFRYAKSEFEKAKKMSVAQATKLPYGYHKVEIRKRREEEEDRVIPVIQEDDDYTKLS